jgi:hypothetical protein
MPAAVQRSQNSYTRGRDPGNFLALESDHFPGKMGKQTNVGEGFKPSPTEKITKPGVKQEFG